MKFKPGHGSLVGCLHKQCRNSPCCVLCAPASCPINRYGATLIGLQARNFAVASTAGAILLLRVHNLVMSLEEAAEPGPQDVVASAKKSPPPELPESIRVRSLVILSFWAVVICLGLPIWWRTTSIYRARLPLQDMLEWADGKVSSPILANSSTKAVTDSPCCRHVVRCFHCRYA